jgi:hypothetical protein
MLIEAIGNYHTDGPGGAARSLKPCQCADTKADRWNQTAATSKLFSQNQKKLRFQHLKIRGFDTYIIEA